MTPFRNHRIALDRDNSHSNIKKSVTKSQISIYIYFMYANGLYSTHVSYRQTLCYHIIVNMFRIENPFASYKLSCDTYDEIETCLYSQSINSTKF